MNAQWWRFTAATRYVPLAGIVVGLIGAGIYWLAAQLWPTNVAVVLAMLATAAFSGSIDEEAAAGAWGAPALAAVYFLLIKYNALMGLSSAKGPLPLPEYLTLGWIMVAGQSASRALVVSIMATRAPAARRITSADLGIALILGLAPAAVLGIPGLMGLVVAIALRLGLGSFDPDRQTFGGRLDVAQQVTEAGFYLGALATWRYV